MIVPGGKPRKGNVDTSYVCQEQGGTSCVTFGERKIVVRRAVTIALICDKCDFANLLQKGKLGKRNETNSLQKSLQQK